MIRTTTLLASAALVFACKGPESDQRTPQSAPAAQAPEPSPQAEPEPELAPAKTAATPPSPPARWEPRRKPRLSSESPGLGEVAYTNKDDVFVASTEEVYERLQKLVVAGDTFGARQLAVAGLVWVAPKYVRCRVIDLHGWLDACWEVRLLEGPHAGQIGFIARSDLSTAR